MFPSLNSQAWQTQDSNTDLTHSKPHELNTLLYSFSLYRYWFLSIATNLSTVVMTIPFNIRKIFYVFLAFSGQYLKAFSYLNVGFLFE